MRIGDWINQKKLVYEMRYNKQYEKAQSEYNSDSTNLAVITKTFLSFILLSLIRVIGMTTFFCKIIQEI